MSVKTRHPLQRARLSVAVSGLAIGILLFWLATTSDRPLQSPKEFVSEPSFYVKDAGWVDALREGERVAIQRRQLPDPEQDMILQSFGRLSPNKEIELLSLFVDSLGAVERESRNHLRSMGSAATTNEDELQLLEFQLTAAKRSAVVQMIKNGDYLTVPVDSGILTPPAGFFLTATQSSMLIDENNVPVRVVFPIRIDEHPEVRGVNEVLEQFKSFVTDEFCLEFNSRPFAERKLRIDEHLAAHEEVKRVIRDQNLSPAERRGRLDDLRKQRFPGNVSVDRDRFTLRSRR